MMQLTKIDSKGRVSIPSSMRNYMGIEKGDSFIVAADNKNIRLMPVSNSGNVEVLMKFSSMEALANAINTIAKNNAKIVYSSGSSDKWHAILDTNEIDEKKVIRRIASLKNIMYVKTRKL